ncbi:TonB-dependent receptor [Paraburkholderia sp. J12]|uniref:TonB-dependent receptor n=1 Tax=Paraburkholderia sp. J12 TaxID=2805432 RepID=UPI002ABE637C|nr:TonB-dependent receptor [Paraburkholderia sp. J12]
MMEQHTFYRLTAIAAAVFSMTPAWAQENTAGSGSTAAVAVSGAAATSNTQADTGAHDNPATSAGVKSDGSMRLKDFTVTARRRSESAQKVPAPISTVSGQDLERQRLYRIQDLQQTLPSLNVAFINPRQSSVSIRGIGNNPASDNLEPSVGVYLDNVYLGRPGMAVFDLLDIQQVDLLRGPQGTLFGKNSTAGVLNISTRPPQFKTEGYLEQSVGQDGYAQTKAHLSGPLSDTLAGTLDLEHTHSDGDITNLYNGSQLNGTSNYGVRGQLLWKPNNDLSVRFIADYSTENADTGALLLYGLPPGGTFLSRAALFGVTPVTDPSRYAVDIDTTPHMNVHQGGVSTEVNYKLPAGYTLTSITAARFWNFSPTNDGDSLPVPALSDAGVAVNDHQISQEVRLASPTGGPIDWVVGAYYFYQQTNTTTFTDFGPDADLFQFGVDRKILDGVTSLSPASVETNSAALFGQATWHATSRADFTAGLRGTYEDKTGYVNRDAPFGGTPLTGALLAARNAAVGPYQSGQIGQHGVSPSAMLNFSYKLTSDVLAYATLSHGEKSGGINMAVGSAPSLGANSLLFGPERANDAELGIKSDWFDHRLIFNANLFWTQINGYQATTYVTVPASGLVTQVLANGADVRSRGAEIDLRAKPLRGLTLGFDASYVDATYSSYTDGPCAAEITLATGATTCNLTGKQVSGAPRWIANLSAQYEFYLGHDIDQYLTGVWSLRSNQFGTLDDSQYGKLPGYGILNLATGWRLNSGEHKWDLSIWAHNVFNKRYYLASFASVQNTYTAMAGDPRVVGATLRFTY